MQEKTTHKEAIEPEVVDTSKAHPLVTSEEAELEGRFELAANVASTHHIDYAAMTAELEAREKWINSVLNFVIKRTYPGDWISHDKKSTPIQERTVNMQGAAAERIARDLGISELNRTKPLKVMAGQDHPGHYRYVCEADFVMNKGRANEIVVHAIGIASTLNGFYSHAGKKKPEDIREEYIMRDAWRDCTKQAIKGMLGLRKIPVSKLQELGYDINKIKYVSFDEKEGDQGEKNAQTTAVPAQEMSMVIKFVAMAAFGDKECIDVIGTKNEKLRWWDKKIDSVDGKNLQKFAKEEWLVTFKYTQKGNYKNIVEILEAVPQ